MAERNDEPLIRDAYIRMYEGSRVRRRQIELAPAAEMQPEESSRRLEDHPEHRRYILKERDLKEVPAWNM